MTRRGFLKTTVAGVAVASVAAPSLLVPNSVAAPTPQSASETLVASLYKSLSEEQREQVTFPFDDPLRSKVDNNWYITKPKVGEFYKPDQQAMIEEIFLKLHSPEYAQTVLKQVEHDSNQKGLVDCSVALFGEPGKGKFEFVLTGRHCTRRCDGDSLEGAAFGGPIFYGHAAKSFNEGPKHEGNAYWYQAVRANEVFEMLDGKQRKAALLGSARPEEGTQTVALTGKTAGLPGISASDLTVDQKGHLRKVMGDLLAMFRKEDGEEVMKLVDKAGFDHLHMAFYKNQDIGKDGVWDVWQIEGPSMIWLFRGDPHVHTWVHVRDPEKKA